MIEKMKKITLLVGEKEKGRFLLALRKAGVVHIEETQNQEVKSLIVLRRKLERFDKAASILTLYGDEGKAPPQKLKEHEILDKVDIILKAAARKEQNLQDIANKKKEEKWFDLWGRVNPHDIEDLKDRDIHIKLYRIRKGEYKKIKDTSSVKIIKEDKTYYYVSLISYKAEKGMFQEEIAFPDMTYNALKNTIKSLEEGVQSSEQAIRSCLGLKNTLIRHMKKLEKSRRFQAVRYGMNEEGKFSFLVGYCPVKDLKNVLALSKREGFGYIVEEPKDNRDVPTKITNPAWIRIIDPVFKFMNTIPGYEEFDVSMVFLLFFSIFFALLIGDAGYGTLFLIITYLARRKLKKAPREPFFLMYVLSISTLVWGALTGTWFGSPEIAKIPFFDSMIIERVNSFIADNQSFMMLACFFIGAIHLTIAHLLKALRMLNSPRMVADLGWISIVWGMFYAAGTLVIDRQFPAFAGYLIAGGIITVLFFANFQKNILKGIAATLSDLPLSVISAFSDVVSYLRLFAVGYASVVVAQSFNDMALGGGVNSVLGGLAAALILLCGHLLNIILGFMAVIVHGIRLNMLEFSGHLGMQWSGKEYKPFSE